MNFYELVGRIVVWSWAFLATIGLYAVLQLQRERLTAWWGMRATPRRGIAPGAAALARLNQDCDALAQRDYGDETDIASEGVGLARPDVRASLPSDIMMVRTPDRRREKRHPLGHRTEPLSYLHDDEWKLWTSVIAESTR